MNRLANHVAKSGLESRALNRSHTLFSLQKLPADLSTCVHYHEKEGNSVPVCSSQWVGIRSLVIGNSIVSLLSSISKSRGNVSFRVHIHVFSELIKCWTRLRTGNLEDRVFPERPLLLRLLCTSAHACCSLGPRLHKKTSVLLTFQGGFSVRKNQLTQMAGAGTSPFRLSSLAPSSCLFIL